MQSWSLLAGLLATGPAAAHSFGRSYTLPIPLTLYAWGAASALLLSFLAAAFFLRHGAGGGPAETVRPATGRATSISLGALSALGLGLLALAIVSGFVGHPNSNVNINMTLFWIVFVLAYPYASAVIGGSYEHINPWRTLVELPARWWPRLAAGRWHYPERTLAYWPAVVLYLGFIWVELFGNTKPYSLSTWLLGYSGFNLVGAVAFGTRAWFRYVELFAVLLRLVSMMAPLTLAERDGRRCWVWRWPFAGLANRSPSHFSLAAFVICTLAATAYDGFHETVPWLRFFWSTLVPAIDPDAGLRALYLYQPWLQRWQWAGLLFAVVLYLAAYVLAVWLGARLARAVQPLGELLRAFAFSLVPIALVYHVSHYYTLVQTEGLRILPLASDPFGWRWDLFGTADWFQYAVIPNVGVTWHAQVALIILGHVVSVVLAHHQAVRLFATRRAAALSQLPMLALMVGYTTAGLWILSLPLEAERFM